MKIDRLLSITIYLLNHQKATAQELADRFEVSTRTIMRDMDTLSLSGIPIVTLYGSSGGYELLDTYKMDRQLTNDQDYSYIVTALQGLQSAFQQKELDHTLEKVQALFQKKSAMIDRDIVLDFSIISEKQSINDKLKKLQEAVKLRYVVRFSYTNAANEFKTYEVEPVATMYKWYSWYLLCYFPKYEDYRIFKVVRMEDIFITGEKNCKVHMLEEAITKWEQSLHHNQTIQVKLFCNNRIKAKVEEYLNGTVIEEYQNGDFIYEMWVPENEHFWYGTVLGLSEYIMVIEPASLIERIKANCKQILEKYEEV